MTNVEPTLYVDTMRGEKLQINLDVVFHHLPCAYVSLDAMDVSGESQLEVQHNIYKKRLSRSGDPIPDGVEKETDLGKPKAERAQERAAADVATTPPPCGSCYGAEQTPNQCCNTCEEVREAYRVKGWSFADPDGVEQCRREGWKKKLLDQQGEGCHIFGYLLVNKVAGNFHFAPGKSFQNAHMHIHDLQPFAGGKFNLSHTIQKLSFGTPFPGAVNPLDNVVKSTPVEGSAIYQYFIKVVPTVYENLAGQVLNTNQFSVTEHFRPLAAEGATGHGHGQEHGLPGVFFLYDLSPLVVKYTEKRKSFTHFLTGVCAIIGGVFTVGSLIDAVLNASLRSFKKKVELGKAS